MERNQLVKMYFSHGYSYSLIVSFLFFVHGISVSLRHLKRILSGLNLRRRSNRRIIDLRRLTEAIAVIREELKSSGSMLGYRSLWKRLQIQYDIYLPRDVVMVLLRILSPHDSRQRTRHCLIRRIYSSKGPNHLWHIDGMDKLKQFGFAIHGCIDGYSRRVIWLSVGTSNNDPEVIAYYYLKAVKEIGGVPKVVRSDLGTENVNIAFLQPYLRRNHDDQWNGPQSFKYGKSTSNQRIEAWWSQLRKKFTHWWSSFFKALQENDLYDNMNFIHVDCLRLCFMQLIKIDLERNRIEWNAHRIRFTRNSVCPSGHPNELYFLPQILGVEDELCELDARDLQVAYNYAKLPDPPGTLEFLLAAKTVMDRNRLEMPNNIEEALELYATLSTILENYMV